METHTQSSVEDLSHRNGAKTTVSPDQVFELLAALRRIAAIPLWGESIADQDLRAEYVHAGEYDAGADDFNPSCDTESTYLRDAVELARVALLSVDGSG